MCSQHRQALPDHSRTVCCELAQTRTAARFGRELAESRDARGSRPGSQLDRGLVPARVEASTTGSRAVHERHRQSCLRLRSTVGRPSARGWPRATSDQPSRRWFAHTFTMVWRSPVAIKVPWRVRSSHTPGLMWVIVMRPPPRPRRRRRRRCRPGSVCRAVSIRLASRSIRPAVCPSTSRSVSSAYEVRYGIEYSSTAIPSDLTHVKATDSATNSSLAYQLGVLWVPVRRTIACASS